jgi:predicted ATPase/class 3 adenylate cyclase
VSRLPAGTVTFLFTDIEGSTRKWQNWPHKMKIALKRHDEILQKAIDDSGGWVFKTVGDAFCAAFHTAMDCINCVIETQIAINSEEWDLPELIKVRMSIHTGEAIERNNDYYGPALNRVARLEALAYGGQILMSLVTAELIRDMLPEPAGLKFMGDHRLKDLTRPEGVYQLTHPEIPEEFPAIKSLDSHPHNLSVQPGLLIGREKELGILQDKLLASKSRVVTVTGTGGMGKTRISLQTAAELIENFRNGVFFIDLTLIANSASFYSLILSTLSIKEAGGKSEFELLKGYLKDKDILLILDNFEHIMDAAVHVSKLLAECHGVKVLVTSREALHIRGERVFRLPPLKVPLFNRGKLPSVKKLSQYDSIRLFIERAVEINEGFKINNKNAPAVAEICVRLDGIPLAIELAAARISALSPQALLKRLNHRLEILTFGAIDLPDRQQTLRTTIDWSFDLLDKPMQNLFMSLSIFAGGFDIDAAELVCPTSADCSVLDGIEHLLEKSLLIKKDLPGGEPWFYMLETIHEYASDQLANNELHITVKGKYAEYFFALAEEGEMGIQSPRQKHWMDKLFSNHNNLAAVLLLFEINKETEKLARMAGALSHFWQYKGLYSEGISWCRGILNIGIEDKDLESKINTGLGILLRESGQHEESRKVFVNVLNCRPLENINNILMKFELAWTLYRLNDFDESERTFNAVFHWAEDQKDGLLIAKTQLGLGTIYWRRGDFEKAEQNYLSSLEVIRGIGNPRSEALVTNNLGIIYYQKNILKKAERYFILALNIFRNLGEEDNLRDTLNNLGFLYFQKKEYLESIKKYKELISLIKNTDDDLFHSTAYSGLASSYLELGKIDTAFTYADKARAFVDSWIESPEYGISLRILGDISRLRKEYDLAHKMYEDSILILDKSKEKEEMGIAIEGLKKLKLAEN